MPGGKKRKDGSCPLEERKEWTDQLRAAQELVQIIFFLALGIHLCKSAFSFSLWLLIPFFNLPHRHRRQNLPRPSPASPCARSAPLCCFDVGTCQTCQLPSRAVRGAFDLGEASQEEHGRSQKDSHSVHTQLLPHRNQDHPVILSGLFLILSPPLAEHSLYARAIYLHI